MPEDCKKKQQKPKQDPKEQRKPRPRNHLAPATAEKNVEKKSEPNIKVQTKPVYEEPGPEFYKGLKRETDEILKITEEANAKYKKKEIQSNWAKYEMPIESYEEMENQENMGADYEKLIQAPLSIGGHFQFKHEKSWDLNTGPSLYDSYFDINMDNLATALSTIPFYERNSIDKTLFSQTDTTNMDNRSARYKEKYYNDKSLSISETQEESIKDGIINSDVKNITSDKQDIILEKPSNFNKPRIDNKDVIRDSDKSKENETYAEKETAINIARKSVPELSLGNKDINDDLDDILLDSSEPVDNVDRSTIERKVDLVPKNQENCPQQASVEVKLTKDNVQEFSTSKSAKPPVIESPEDLEKWLDDFLEN